MLRSGLPSHAVGRAVTRVADSCRGCGIAGESEVRGGTAALSGVAVEPT